ncbi:ABC transporter substrate-binding protein [Devosia sp.]|uniref:ABC transporter substrate-binding protein n=1 Tax=Devosia sp. TaxID=1871048 RepID=UPI002F1846C0
MFSRTKNALLGLSALAALFISPSAQGFDGVSPEIMAAALQEGQLVIYASSAAPVMDAAVEGFRAAVPGIEVNVLRLATNPLTTRYVQEVEAGVHVPDVLDLSATRLLEANPDWFAPLTEQEIPILAEWPDGVKKGHYINTLQGIMLIAYNTDLVQGDHIPLTWEDILKEEYRGKGMLVDPRSSSSYMAWLDLMDVTYGPEYIEKLKAQNFTLVEGGTQGVQQVAAGGAELVIPPAFAHAQPFIEKQAPIGVSIPNDHSDVTAIGPQHSWAIAAKAPNPNAARVFMAWFLSQESQRINCALSGGSSAVVTDLPACPVVGENYMAAETDLSQERVDDLLNRLGVQ